MTKEQRRAYDKDYYQKTKSWRGARRKANFEAQKLRYRTSKVKYLLKHPCVDCGEKDPVVLDFDHRDGEDKKFTIGKNMSMHWSPRLLKEVNKCDIRCANCHRRKTARQFKWEVLNILKTIRA